MKIPSGLNSFVNKTRKIRVGTAKEFFFVFVIKVINNLFYLYYPEGDATKLHFALI